MNSINDKEVIWKLIAFDFQGVEIASIPLSINIMPKIREVIIENEFNDSVVPDNNIQKDLQLIINKNKLSIETISKLVSIKKKYLVDLLNGEYTPISIQKYIRLIKIIEVLK